MFDQIVVEKLLHDNIKIKKNVAYLWLTDLKKAYGTVHRGAMW